MLLIDTNVVSMIFKRDSRAVLYEPHLTGALKGISFMTRAELALWPLVAGWGQDKSSRLEEASGPTDRRSSLW